MVARVKSTESHIIENPISVDPTTKISEIKKRSLLKPRLGIKHTEQTIQKIKEKRKQQVFSKESLLKRGRSLKLYWENKKTKKTA
jgi:hypothetical protein